MRLKTWSRIWDSNPGKTEKLDGDQDFRRFAIISESESACIDYKYLFTSYYLSDTLLSH